MKHTEYKIDNGFLTNASYHSTHKKSKSYLKSVKELKVSSTKTTNVIVIKNIENVTIQMDQLTGSITCGVTRTGYLH